MVRDLTESVSMRPAQRMPTITELKDAAVAKAGKWKWILGAGAILLLGPILWTLALSLMGLGAAIVAGLLVYVLTQVVAQFAPVMADKIKNRAFEAIMAEAEAHPIPTLWNEQIKDEEDLETFHQQIMAYDGVIRSTETKASKLMRNLSPDAQQVYQENIDAMKTDLADQQVAYDELAAEIKEQETAVVQAEALWKLGGYMEEADKAGRMVRGDRLGQLKKEVAFDAVNDRVGRARAKIEDRIRRGRTLSDLRAEQRAASVPVPVVASVTTVEVKQ